MKLGSLKHSSQAYDSSQLTGLRSRDKSRDRANLSQCLLQEVLDRGRKLSFLSVCQSRVSGSNFSQGLRKKIVFDALQGCRTSRNSFDKRLKCLQRFSLIAFIESCFHLAGLLTRNERGCRAENLVNLFESVDAGHREDKLLAFSWKHNPNRSLELTRRQNDSVNLGLELFLSDRSSLELSGEDKALSRALFRLCDRLLKLRDERCNSRRCFRELL